MFIKSVFKKECPLERESFCAGSYVIGKMECLQLECVSAPYKVVWVCEKDSEVTKEREREKIIYQTFIGKFLTISPSNESNW